MGKEYTFRVPESAHEAVANALSQHLQPLLRRLDSRSAEAFPSVYAKAIPGGLYLCDNLTDPSVAAAVFRGAVDLLLLYAPSVSVTEE